ncbi:hypothetical protein EG329_013337 [Mollisiaceae sp. DMI_Dod_QoI]|nr:hypothetical protein EG329_013337 [Helotiales sp. DMI_Dod_QoI]
MTLMALAHHDVFENSPSGKLECRRQYAIFEVSYLPRSVIYRLGVNYQLFPPMGQSLSSRAKSQLEHHKSTASTVEPIVEYQPRVEISLGGPVVEDGWHSFSAQLSGENAVNNPTAKNIKVQNVQNVQNVTELFSVASHMQTLLHSAVLVAESTTTRRYSNEYNGTNTRPISPIAHGASSRSYTFVTSQHNEFSKRSSSSRRPNTLVTQRSAEQISTLGPSLAFLATLRPSSRSKSVFTQKCNNYPPLSRRTCSAQNLRSSLMLPALGSPLIGSSLWSPTSEETDIYRLNLLSSPHYCTYGCKDKSFQRKSDWIKHEEQAHDPPVLYTCLLHVSETLATDPCPAESCVSTMDTAHLAYFHDSFYCFEKPSPSVERYQTNNLDLLLEHLDCRHGLRFETVPDYCEISFSNPRNEYPAHPLPPTYEEKSATTFDRDTHLND